MPKLTLHSEQWQVSAEKCLHLRIKMRFCKFQDGQMSGLGDFFGEMHGHCYSEAICFSSGSAETCLVCEIAPYALTSFSGIHLLQYLFKISCHSMVYQLLAKVVYKFKVLNQNKMQKRK